MITERRIFQAKTGEAGAVLAKIKEAQPIQEKLGSPSSRVYTDFYSGRTDRVVWELDHESIGMIETFYQTMSRDQEFTKFFETWFKELQSLIEGATVELWHREV